MASLALEDGAQRVNTSMGSAHAEGGTEDMCWKGCEHKQDTQHKDTRCSELFILLISAHVACVSSVIQSAR